jgi:hypothetical protein
VDGGRPGSSQVISWSLDFLEWTPIRTNAYPAEPWTFSVPIEMSTGFFRVEHISAQ